jgi:hypothetical protein
VAGRWASLAWAMAARVGRQGHVETTIYRGDSLLGGLRLNLAQINLKSMRIRDRGVKEMNSQ